MTENFTFATDRYAVRDRLRPLLILIGETLEGAVPIVLDNIKRQELEFSPFLFSTNVRCHLKKALQNKGYNPQDTLELVPLAINKISNDGVDFEYGHLRLKVLKGDALPRATSENREKFYSQQIAFPFKQLDYADTPLRNLIVLWDYELASAKLSILLVAPKTKEGELLWQLSVPSPVEWILPHDILGGRDKDLEIGDQSAAEESQVNDLRRTS